MVPWWFSAVVNWSRGRPALWPRRSSRWIPQTKRIIPDLSELTRMNTLGLGTIISLYVSATAAGSDLRLINLGKRIHRSFHADVRSPKLDVDRAARGLFAG